MGFFQKIVGYTSNNGKLFTTESEIYTSYSPEYVRDVYPGSLINMRNQLARVLGQNTDVNLLPKWMTSQQLDGNTLGFTRAWLICYTKPGFANIIKNNIIMKHNRGSCGYSTNNINDYKEHIETKNKCKLLVAQIKSSQK